MRDAAYRVASAHFARRTPFDTTFIEGLRKEFLLLMKNAKIVKDPKMAEAWRRAMGNWRERFNDLIYKRLKDAIGNIPLQYPHVSRDEATKWQRYVGTNTWDLYIHAGVPFHRDPNFDEETSFYRYQRDLKKWQGQVRRGARKAWKTLNEFVSWYRYTTQAGDPAIDIPAEEQTTIEGFQVLVKGFDNTAFHNEYLERFKISLRLYKSRAAKVFPLLLRKQLPLVLDFKAEIDTGGEYIRGQYISISYHASEKNPGRMAQILAHEMGHHIYQTYLSGEARKFWYSAITGNYGKLDLNDVLRRYGTGSFYDNAQIKKQDPILWLQIQGVFESYDHVFAPRTGPSLFGMDDVREYLDNGGQAVWTVHGKPITGYAHKNPEEAFCEALGMLVGYGPRTVLPEVRSWLQTILPNLKIASAHRVATRHLAREEGLPVLELPRGSIIFHGTHEEFDRIKPGGYDNVAWFADNPAIAQLYMAAASGSKYADPEKIAQPSRDPFIQEVQSILGIEFDLSEVVKWDGDAPGWPRSPVKVTCSTCDGSGVDPEKKRAPLPPYVRPGAPNREKQLKSYLACRSCYGSGWHTNAPTYVPKDGKPVWLRPPIPSEGKEAEGQESALIDRMKERGIEWARAGNWGFEIPMVGGHIARPGERPQGRLVVGKTTRPLLLAYDPSASDYGSHDHALFNVARKLGLDGVRIYDYAQSQKHGNVAHVSVGLFVSSLRSVRLRSIPATYREWKGRKTTPEWTRTSTDFVRLKEVAFVDLKGQITRL